MARMKISIAFVLVFSLLATSNSHKPQNALPKHRKDLAIPSLFPPLPPINTPPFHPPPFAPFLPPPLTPFPPLPPFLPPPLPPFFPSPPPSSDCARATLQLLPCLAKVHVGKTVDENCCDVFRMCKACIKFPPIIFLPPFAIAKCQTI
ncbi:hypothetical protein M5689_001060 [Euphorbia peplus]|nr:hypothetical protein M5689_001060 [Euphorbia peplus]